MANVRSELPIDTVIQTGKTEDPLCQPKTRSVKVGVINKSIVWFCEISQILRNTPRVLGPDDYVNASCAAGTTLRFLSPAVGVHKKSYVVLLTLVQQESQSSFF